MNLDQITIGQIIGYGRDLTVIGLAIRVSWKIRGAWDEIREFLKRITEHMDKVETGMELLLENHLGHIQNTLERIADAEVSANKPQR